MMDNELATIKKDLRFVKVYALLMTVLFTVLAFSGFTQSAQKNIEEITAKRIRIMDSNGKVRVIVGSDLKGNDSAGLLFFNEEGHECGALFYGGKRDKDGKIDAWSRFTMDQFKSDQIVALEYDHSGDQKRQGISINDRPDTLSPQAEELLTALQHALESAKSDVERQSIRREYLSRIPAREIVARRLFAGRDVEGSSLVTLADLDGKPRLRLQVDKLGKASISFLDPSGRTLRIIKP